jgi:hypothetical protein
MIWVKPVQFTAGAGASPPAEGALEPFGGEPNGPGGGMLWLSPRSPPSPVPRRGSNWGAAAREPLTPVGGGGLFDSPAMAATPPDFTVGPAGGG